MSPPAFTAGTGDLRESPALAIAHRLVEPKAAVTAYDPRVPASNHPDLDELRVVDDPYLVAEEARALVVLTEWPEFRALDWPRPADAVERAVVVDTRNLLDESLLDETGFTVFGTGIAR
ncbi:UDP-glucose/GDP-mannose dehydrogenase family protein [Nocardia higoensis]|uniref:UDP-glucose/GDP-mannose dehydrogenase family protein n=1 Tax=Nocardia higoensis TaxID=228599 RepID=UPI002B4AD606|nr:UDP-glucose/GDP-mannose dehydrogenase family protein [Nocardia higoensis]